jgi:pSer/pThr/pTyr-binding forkhead associated (FHA) protein
MDGVNSIGRHDDCAIRIRSSQVSRRHCEVFEDKGRLMVKDLGSSNGTFVNGKRVLGQQMLKPGDELSLGGVTLRVDLAGGQAATPGKPTSVHPSPGDTAEVEAIAIEEDDLVMDEEFEVSIDDHVQHMDVIPLDDEPLPVEPYTTTKAASPSAANDKNKKSSETTEIKEPVAKPESTPEEEDAVAQFLMDLKLDEED